MGREVRRLVVVWVGLVVLLTSTVLVTFAPFGPIKPVINLMIAAAKAGLIVWVYMHLREQRGLNRIAALAAAAWLMILVTMMMTDLSTRDWCI